MIGIFPRLKIHAWGGLGSQLFAVALALDIQKLFPRRRILIVLHTGGVTRRLPEVTSLFPDLAYAYVEDYATQNIRNNDGTSSPKRIQISSLRLWAKKLLAIFGFVTSCNNDMEFAHLKPWVLSCRGHYSYRTIDISFLTELNLRLKSEGLSINSRESCAIHYRLGDLLTLNEKNPISRERIVLEYQKLEALWNFERLIVFSDSPEKAFQLFEGVTALEFIAPDYSTLEVMALSINAKFFVGTSSKISFWISGVRSQVRLEPSLLPSNNLLQYRGLVGIEMKGISTYQPNA